EDPNIVHNKPQIEQNQHQNDIKPQENKTGDDVQTEKQIKSSSESNFKQTNKLLNDKENNILSNDNEIEKTSAVKPNVSIKSDKIGRASCRERVKKEEGAVAVERKRRKRQRARA